MDELPLAEEVARLRMALTVISELQPTQTPVALLGSCYEDPYRIAVSVAKSALGPS